MRAAILAAAVAFPVAAWAQEGIPPHVAQKAGIPPEKAKQVQEMTWKAGEELIGLEADLKRAQLALDREIRSAAPDEAQVGKLVDAVSKAEAALKKNRIVLMLRIRKLVGDEAWAKLEALRQEEGPRGPGGPGMLMEGGPHRGPMGPPPPGFPPGPGMGPGGPGR